MRRKKKPEMVHVIPPDDPVGYIMRAECMVDTELGRALAKERILCGCPKCRPDAYCHFVDAEGKKCKDPRFHVPNGPDSEYCFDHYRRIVRQEGMKPIREILRELAGAMPDKGA